MSEERKVRVLTGEECASIGMSTEEVQEVMESLHEKGFLKRVIIDGESCYELTTLGELALDTSNNMC